MFFINNFIRYHHKSKKWWKKFFYTWLAIVITNCHVISSRFFHQRSSIKEFQNQIIKGLLESAGVVLEVQGNLMNDHYPIKIGDGKSKRCKLCYVRTKNPSCSKTSYKCYKCSQEFSKDICLCVLCFKDFHANRSNYI